MANSSLALKPEELWKRGADLSFAPLEPKFLPLHLPALKTLFLNGLSRGAMVEVNGLRSSGRTSVSLHVLAQATRAGEICAVVDLHNSFDPASAVVAGARLDRIVWIRCGGNAVHALRTADLLLHAGGFGVVLLDLYEATARVLNRIPLSYWYRFRRAIENTPAILLVCADTPQAKSCSPAGITVRKRRFHWSGKAPFLLLRGMEINATLKPATPAAEPLSIRTVA
jgi:recA bacterial DNA recombination protein